MTICHRVIPIRQANPMTCWRASVDMIHGYYGVRWESTPGRGMPGEAGWQPAVVRSQFNPASPYTLQTARSGSDGPQTTGLQASDFGGMAAHYGFQRLDNDRIQSWSAPQLENCLRRCGPLWHALNRPFKHVVVVTGVGTHEGQPAASVNDPATGQKEFWPLDVLNNRMVNTDNNPLYYPRRRNRNGRGSPSNQIVQLMSFGGALAA